MRRALTGQGSPQRTGSKNIENRTTNFNRQHYAAPRVQHAAVDAWLALREFQSMTGQFQRAGGDTLAKAPRLLDARWALRRALLGLCILAVGIGTMAWLTHASIDPTLEAVAAQSTQRQ
jgi:hypothetical protein